MTDTLKAQIRELDMELEFLQMLCNMAGIDAKAEMG